MIFASVRGRAISVLKRFIFVGSLRNWCQANGIMGLAPDRGSETVLQQIFKECFGGFGGGTPEPRCKV